MPEILINNSFLTERARDYAALSELAYADWYYDEGVNAIMPSEYKALWLELKNKGYSFVEQKKNDSATGYSGTLFEFNGQKILANRGSDGLNDASADGAIALHETPSEQFRSMVEFINTLKSNGQITGSFDVTGHSLGGCLAQMAAVSFSQEVNAVYTYNAPGALNLLQNYCLLPDTENQGYVTVRHFDPSGLLGYEDKVWKKSSWDLYSQFLTQRASVDSSRVYNVSGVVGPSPVANHDQDIGGEVFVDREEMGSGLVFQHNLGY
jgi:pimeloyl-ACP methyl ester carboxylesterase